LVGYDLRHDLGGEVLACLVEEASDGAELATPVQVALLLSCRAERWPVQASGSS